MCTLTWQTTADGYRLLFNRDERVSRPTATPPVCVDRQDLAAIMPIDTQAGGTWISVNALGFSFCLINNYGAEQRIHHVEAPTRGLLASQLASSRSVDQARAAFEALQPERMNPFDLFVFEPNGSARCWRWNGLQLTDSEPWEPFAFSSGFDPAGVIESRRTLFHQWLNSGSDLLDYHRSHLPMQGAYSVCMHRDDAATQSLSEVLIEADRIRFTYWPGPPCRTTPLTPLCLPRREA